MTQNELAIEAHKLLEVSVDDLQCARILYESKNYRNSFYLFQQSVEKANKGFGLYLGLIDMQKLKGKIGHMPVKIYTAFLDEQQQKLKQLAPALSALPTLPQDFLNSETLDDYNSGLAEVIGFIPKVNSNTLLKFSISEIDDLLDSLYETMFEKLDPPSRNSPHLAEIFMIMIHWFEDIDTIQASEYRNEVIAALNDSTQKEHVFSYIQLLFKTINSLSFTMAAFVVLAIFTNQHGSRPRYHEDDFNPITTYTKKYPTILRQRDLMDLLEEAIKQFKRYINYSEKKLAELGK